MENTLLHKVYEMVNHFIHLNDLKHSLHLTGNQSYHKICPVTGLDISMQPNNSKFLSYTGVKWYFEHNRKLFDEELSPRLTEAYRKRDSTSQFKEIAHSIRNSDSNPRNNTRRAIQRLLHEDNSLFNNLQLIDRNKLKEAGLQGSSGH